MCVLTVNEFSGFALCRFRESVYPSNTPLFSQTFSAGLHALTGQIDIGGWVFSYLLTHAEERKPCLSKGTSFLWNYQPISLSALQEKSCYVGDINKTTGNMSAAKQFSKFKRRKNLFITESELRDMFCLTEERWNRPLSHCGNESYRITAALGYAAGKRVFCLPWMTNSQVKYYWGTITFLADFF